jgi:outer membrane protein assembly factor BamD
MIEEMSIETHHPVSQHAQRQPGATMRLPIALAATLVVLTACSSAPKRGKGLGDQAAGSDAQVWATAQKAYEKKQWEAARSQFKRIVDVYPQSDFGAEARLMLGDVYFAEGGTANYILAIASYREFLTLYPSHPKAAYGQAKLADCYFRQKHSPGRDQTSTRKAIEEYERLLEFHPDSAYTQAARERILACRNTLARHDFEIGLFYERTRGAVGPAIRRYEAVLQEYPDFSNLDEVLFHLAQCLSASSRYAEALPVVDRLVTDFPKSAYVPKARALAATVESFQHQLARPASPGPSIPASPSPSPAAPPASPDPSSAT